MAEVSRGRGVFGRLLAATGLVWVFWAFFGPMIGLEFGNSFLNLPILPGLLIFFVGRAIARGSRRGELKPRGTRSPQDQAPLPKPRFDRPAPVSEKIRREPPTPVEPIVTYEATLEAMETPESQPPIDGTTVRKTSAEMVAEARERYGKRS